MINTSLGSKRDFPKNILNTSNHLSSNVNSSFRLLTSQGELGSSRNEEGDLSGFLMGKSSFKQKKFPIKRKISLKVDGKKFQENHFFLIPENKNNSSLKKYDSPNKELIQTRLKTIRNSDVTAKRNNGRDNLPHSKSLNSSGIHTLGKKQIALGNFNLKKYSLSKDNHSISINREISPKNIGKEIILIKSNRPSIDQTDNLKNEYLQYKKEKISQKKEMNKEIFQKKIV